MKHPHYLLTMLLAVVALLAALLAASGAYAASLHCEHAEMHHSCRMPDAAPTTAPTETAKMAGEDCISMRERPAAALVQDRLHLP